VTSHYTSAAAAGTLSPGAVTDPAGLAAAAAVLDWPGLVLPIMRLLGTRVAPVLTVDTAAHDRRRQRGIATPMLDADTLAVWEWPQAADACPPSVVRLRGVLVPAGRSWATAAATARRWAGFGATAIVLPADQPSELCRLECGYAGIAITAAADGEVRLVAPGRPGRSGQARRRTLDRWLEERLYGRLLSAGVLAA